MDYKQDLDIAKIINKIGDNVVYFEYIDILFNNEDRKQCKVENLHTKLLVVFLTRMLMLRDYRKPVRSIIKDLKTLENLDGNFIDCIITANFKINENNKYICFFSQEELNNQKSLFTSDFLNNLIIDKTFNNIFSLFIPIEILYFENYEQQNKDFYIEITEQIEQCEKNYNLLFSKITKVIEYIMYLPLEIRVYLSQIFCLDYRDMIFTLSNKLIHNNYQINSIKNTSIYYY